MVTFWQYLNETFGIGYTLAIVTIGALIIGFVMGILSVFFVNQKQSILGDTIAHTTLPGIVLAFLLILEQNRLYLILGGLMTAVLSVLFVNFIKNKTYLKPDVAIAISLSFFTGIGLALLSYLQRASIFAQSGLSHYLIGNIAYLGIEDLNQFFLLATIVLSLIVIFYKEFKFIIFDEESARVLGIRVNLFQNFLLMLVAITIVLAVENIGVVLVAGLLIAPAVASRRWSDRFHWNLIIAGLIGAVSSVIGVVGSSRMEGTPQGPSIIVVLSIVTLCSVFFGSKNGMFINWLHVIIFHRRVDHQATLKSFMSSTDGLFRMQGPAILEFNPQDFPQLDSSILSTLCECGYCKMVTDTTYVLTYRGAEAIRSILISGGK